MASCWNCGSFAKETTARCAFCGAIHPEAKPRWIAALDALPGPQDDWPHFGLYYLGWFVALAAFGIWCWPWWAALGAIVFSLLLAVPATMLSAVLMQQVARLWQWSRPTLSFPANEGGLLALEEQTRCRLREDQAAFDGLIGIMNREQRSHDLLPEAEVVEYRKHKVLPVFSKMVKLSVSALLEIELRRLLNQCEQICDGIETCDHREFNTRYERLEALQRELGATKNRWSGYVLSRVTTPEVAALSENGLTTSIPVSSRTRDH